MRSLSHPRKDSEGKHLFRIFIYLLHDKTQKLQLLKLFKRKKYNSVSSSSSFQGTDMIGGEAPRSNREGGMARTGAPGSVTGKGPPWRGLGLRDTAPALQSITKHNHMARAGDEDCFDSEQRIQGWKGVASQIWTEAQRAAWPRLHTGLRAPLPPQAVSVQE